MYIFVYNIQDKKEKGRNPDCHCQSRNWEKTTTIKHTETQLKLLTQQHNKRKCSHVFFSGWLKV